MRPLLARYPVAKFAADLSSTGTPIAVGTWAQLLAATTAPACAAEIFNSTGSILRISLGAPGLEDASEVPYYVLPGGSPILLPMEIAKGSPISVTALDNATISGYIIINFFG